MTAEFRRTMCPDAEQLAEFADGGLSDGERQLMEAHLSECDDCYEAVVEIAAITAALSFCSWTPRTRMTSTYGRLAKTMPAS